jgi:hypothetical protein
MPSLDESFQKLLEHLTQPHALNPAQSDPIYYFVHDPSETFTVKQKLDVWSARLKDRGWEVITISLSQVLWDLIKQSGRWDEWLQLESDAEVTAINESVRDVLRSGNAFVEAIAKRISEVHPKTVVFLTDAHALHPYFRIRTLESGLHDRIKSPTVICYPGRRSGQYGLHFLDFYPVDGNYRSTIIGGMA